MKYFDNKFLKQYLDSGQELKVYVDSDWYSISDMSDLNDPVDGIGYDEYGKSHYFSYRNIEQIKIGNVTYTIDMLQGEPEPESKGKGSEKSEEEPAMPEEEPEKEEKPTGKGPDLSWYSPVYDIGKMLIKESKRKRKK